MTKQLPSDTLSNLGIKAWEEEVIYVFLQKVFYSENKRHNVIKLLSSLVGGYAIGPLVSPSSKELKEKASVVGLNFALVNGAILVVVITGPRACLNFYPSLQNRNDIREKFSSLNSCSEVGKKPLCVFEPGINHDSSSVQALSLWLNQGLNKSSRYSLYKMSAERRVYWSSYLYGSLLKTRRLREKNFPDRETTLIFSNWRNKSNWLYLPISFGCLLKKFAFLGLLPWVGYWRNKTIVPFSMPLDYFEKPCCLGMLGRWSYLALRNNEESNSYGFRSESNLFRNNSRLTTKDSRAIVEEKYQKKLPFKSVLMGNRALKNVFSTLESMIRGTDYLCRHWSMNFHSSTNDEGHRLPLSSLVDKQRKNSHFLNKLPFIKNNINHNDFFGYILSKNNLKRRGDEKFKFNKEDKPLFKDINSIVVLIKKKNFLKVKTLFLLVKGKINGLEY